MERKSNGETKRRNEAGEVTQHLKQFDNCKRWMKRLQSGEGTKNI